VALQLPARALGWQEAQLLTNADVVSLTEAGVPAENIVSRIESASADFDTAVGSLVSLSRAGVAPAVLEAMNRADVLAGGGRVSHAGVAPQETPAELEALPPEMRTALISQAKAIEAIEDPAQLDAVLQQIDAQAGQVPDEMRPWLDWMRGVIEERLAELREGEGGEQ
jgi:hypothetical protein